MKNTQLAYAILLSIFMFGCNESDNDILEKPTGKVVFSSQMADMEPIILKNAKTQEFIKSEGKPWVTIKKGSEDGTVYGEVIYDNYLDESNSLELEAGYYAASLKLITQEGEHKDRVEAESWLDHQFEVIPGQETKVTIEIQANYIWVHVALEGLDGATVWVGPKDFTPSDEYLHDLEKGSAFYLDAGGFEVVVEFEGQTKRFAAPASSGKMYFVFITNEPTQGTQPGTAGFVWEYLWGDNAKQPLEFKW